MGEGGNFSITFGESYLYVKKSESRYPNHKNYGLLEFNECINLLIVITIIRKDRIFENVKELIGILKCLNVVLIFNHNLLVRKSSLNFSLMNETDV